jgi:polyisoprenoid-binding protein YceI
VPHVSQTLSDLPVLEGQWSLDPDRTTVEFHTKIMRVISVKGRIKATEGRASVVTDGSIDGTLILDVATIDTGIKKRDDHLRTADFFDADRYPTIEFMAQSARRLSSGGFEVRGNLTIHGQTRPLITLVEIRHLPTEVSVSANIELDRTAWGVGRTRLGPSTAARVVVTAHFVRE